MSLGRVRELRHIKLFPERIAASNVLSDDGKQYPVVAIGAAGIVGVELLVDTSAQVVQFYALTSCIRGGGCKMVAAVMDATPEDWQMTVVCAWSGGFWRRMAVDYPRLAVC